LDIEEFLYKYYDINELLKIKDKFIKKSKEYGILKIKLMMNLRKLRKKMKKIGQQNLMKKLLKQKNPKIPKRKIL
jgi:hypothetical protein